MGLRDMVREGREMIAYGKAELSRAGVVLETARAIVQEEILPRAKEIGHWIDGFKRQGGITLELRPREGHTEIKVVRPEDSG